MCSLIRGIIYHREASLHAMLCLASWHEASLPPTYDNYLVGNEGTCRHSGTKLLLLNTQLCLSGGVI